LIPHCAFVKPLQTSSFKFSCGAVIWSALVLANLLISCSGSEKEPETKIVLLAGKKSHGPGTHEYIKTVRLIKAMLDRSPNLPNVSTEIYYGGWPEDAATLDDADLILTISDGRDGPLFSPVPFMTEERMAVIRKQMNRGCGLALIHFSTFASDHFGSDILEWSGGYFDWQGDDGERKWYSAIETLKSEVHLNRDHEISNGISQTFTLEDEFYYKIRFKDNDSRLTPLLEVPELETVQDMGKVVAWCVERSDGGRGFATTTGHFFYNWQNPEYRTLMLNAIAWSAGLDVPDAGVKSDYFTDAQVTDILFGKSSKALILTGNNHPAHDWQMTTPVIRQALEAGGVLHVDVSTDIEDLHYYDLSDYDLLVMNYCNWEDSVGLSSNSKDAFSSYVSGGGGLVLVHFSNGAFHSSLPGASASDWPEYRRICRRVWDHDADSGHDEYGKFRVSPTNFQHPITRGMQSFETEDELYYNQKGELPIEPLLVARSSDTGDDQPLAWAYTYGDGRVFQTVLGHDVKSLGTPEVQALLTRGALWTMDKLQ